MGPRDHNIHTEITYGFASDRCLLCERIVVFNFKGGAT